MSRRPAALAPTLALFLLATAGCGQAPQPAPQPGSEGVAPQSSAAPASSETPASAAQPSEEPVPQAPAADVGRALAEAVAAGRPPAEPEGEAEARVVVSLEGRQRLAGVGATLRFDGARLKLGRLAQEPGLAGFTCQANAGEPGQVRFACVGLTGEERGGALLSFPVLTGGDGLEATAFEVGGVELVDDEANALPSELLVVSVVR